MRLPLIRMPRLSLASIGLVTLSPNPKSRWYWLIWKPNPVPVLIAPWPCAEKFKQFISSSNDSIVFIWKMVDVFQSNYNNGELSIKVWSILLCFEYKFYTMVLVSKLITFLWQYQKFKLEANACWSWMPLSLQYMQIFKLKNFFNAVRVNMMLT